MIAAHSVFLSMSVMDAFCTFRILPRIGSSAWKSEDLAFFAVPSALSPSTMNSSERSTSVERQSASFVGMVEDSSAFLRRETSLCMRAAMRARISETTLSMTSAACSFSPPFFVEMRNSVRRCSTTFATI